jgi:uncharacterized protein with PIN domain
LSDLKEKIPIRFAVDSMLGALSRHLRIMGYDAIYRSYYSDEILSELVQEGRILLTRTRATYRQYGNSIFIDSDLVKDQLKTVDNAIGLTRDRGEWFKRCLVCNSSLVKAKEEAVKDNVPDYIFLKYSERMLFCPSCKKFYWPGTHRQRMLKRLKDWGF